MSNPGCSRCCSWERIHCPEKPSTASDSWSLAATQLQFFTSKAPYEASDENMARGLVSQAACPFPEEGQMQAFTSCAPQRRSCCAQCVRRPRVHKSTVQGPRPFTGAKDFTAELATSTTQACRSKLARVVERDKRENTFSEATRSAVPGTHAGRTEIIIPCVAINGFVRNFSC